MKRLGLEHLLSMTKEQSYNAVVVVEVDFCPVEEVQVVGGMRKRVPFKVGPRKTSGTARAVEPARPATPTTTTAASPARPAEDSAPIESLDEVAGW